MARTRQIKPGFFHNEDLGDLPEAIQLFFVAMWILADREGRLEDRPKKIKREMMPTSNIDPEEAAEGLASKKFITRYEADGISLIQINKWHKHQNPHPNEKPSFYAPPSGFKPEINPDRQKPKQEKPVSPEKPAEKKPKTTEEVEELKLNIQIEESKPPKFSHEARLLVEQLNDALKALGLPKKGGKQKMKDMAVAQAMLKDHSLQTIQQGLKWLLDHPKYGFEIDTFKGVEIFFNKFLLQQRVNQPQYKKGKDGRYTWSQVSDPSFDQTITFNELDLDCQRKRLEKAGLIVNGQPANTQDPNLCAHIREMCETNPGYMKHWQAFYDEVKKDD
jgi:hypothetical protein